MTCFGCYSTILRKLTQSSFLKTVKIHCVIFVIYIYICVYIYIYIYIGATYTYSILARMQHVWSRERDAYRVLLGKPERRRPLGRPRRRWEDNIEIDLREVGWGHGLDRCVAGQEPVAASCKCDNEHSCSIKCGKFLDYLRNCQLLRKDSAPRRELYLRQVQLLVCAGVQSLRETCQTLEKNIR